MLKDPQKANDQDEIWRKVCKDLIGFTSLHHDNDLQGSSSKTSFQGGFAATCHPFFQRGGLVTHTAKAREVNKRGG
jgi:hypothetical protein